MDNKFTTWFEKNEDELIFMECEDIAFAAFNAGAVARKWPYEKDQVLLHFAVSALMYLSGEDELDGDEVAAIAFDHNLMTENGLVDWIGKPTEYTRPELTEAEKNTAAKDVTKLILKYGMSKLTLIIGALTLENIRLVKEINEHRAARGIDPLPTFEV